MDILGEASLKQRRDKFKQDFNNARIDDIEILWKFDLEQVKQFLSYSSDVAYYAYRQSAFAMDELQMFLDVNLGVVWHHPIHNPRGRREVYDAAYIIFRFEEDYYIIVNTMNIFVSIASGAGYLFSREADVIKKIMILNRGNI